MQFRRSVGLGVLVGVLLLAGVFLGVLVWRHPESLGMVTGSARQTLWLSVISTTTFIVVMFLAGFNLLGSQVGRSAYDRLKSDDVRQSAHVSPEESANSQAAQTIVAINAHLRENHGFFWHHKLRLLLVVGEPEQIEAIAPGLAHHQWLASHDTLLLWGGSVQTPLDDARTAPWKTLRRWRPLDGVIWALSKPQSTDAAAMDIGARHLQDLARQLRWQLPLHLWQVCNNPWQQDQRETQSVGCLLPPRMTPQTLESTLANLSDPLRHAGWAQMRGDTRHDFLLRLSRDLQVEGIARWRQALGPLWQVFARGLPLRGVWFSLPLQGGTATSGHHWFVEPPWDGVLGDKAVKQWRIGWGATRVAYSLVLALALIWGAGLLLSFVTNRAQIAQVQTVVASLEQSQSADEQLLAFNELVRELARLNYRAEYGTPWYQRFGLNQNDQLLATLLPRYAEANNRLMRDPIAATLQQQLNALLKLAPDSPERARRAPAAYAQLKAYLMMARPEKTDPVFLAQVLTDAQPQRAGFSPGLWQGLAPALWAFYAEQLAGHPDWRIKADPKLVAQARQASWASAMAKPACTRASSTARPITRRR